VTRIERSAGGPVGSWQEIAYDDAYDVATVTTSFGEVQRFQYDSWDRPIEELVGESNGKGLTAAGSGKCAGSAGVTAQRAFDAAGHVVRERRVQDHVVDSSVACRWVETRYRYNSREQLVAVEQTHLSDPFQPGAVLSGATPVLALSYDEHGRLAEERMAASSRDDLVTRYRYDEAGRVAGTQTGAEAERVMGYDTMSRVVFRTDGDPSDPGVWRGSYDAWDRLYEQELPTGATIRTRFNKAHQPIERQVFGPPTEEGGDLTLLAQTTYEVTSFGKVAKMVEALNGDGASRETVQTFDDSGRVTLIQSGPDGGPFRRDLEIEYEPGTGRIQKRLYGGGVPTKESPTSPQYEEELVYLDGIPWPAEMTEREAVPGQGELAQTFTTTFARDVFGRVRSRSRSDGESVTTTYERGSGDVIEARTGADAVTRITRDARGLPIRTDRPEGRGFTLRSYDLDGVPLREQAATQAGSSVWETAYSYDTTGRVVGMIYADGTVETRSYNPDSTVATRVLRDGVTLSYAYDAANRVVRVAPSGGGDGGQGGTTLLDAGDTFSYDALSRPTRMGRGRPGVGGLDPVLAVAYPSYDLGSRPGAEVIGQRSPLSWSYDVYDNPTEVRLPSGPGRGISGAFQGFLRSFDTLDRLEETRGLGAPALSDTPLGADWKWGGASRLYAVTTRGALGTGARYGYLGGAGPQIPDQPTQSSTEWKLGRLSWGAARAAGATASPTVVWGDFGFGWRPQEGNLSDGAKVGRKVLGSSTTVAGVGAFSNLGWSWGYDGGVRLNRAHVGPGSLKGLDSETTAPPVGSLERFSFAYGAGDELLAASQEVGGEAATFTSGDYGRALSRNGVAFGYDGVGRRLEDDRFVYRWDWRGELVEVTVKATWPDENGDGEPEVSPFAGHRVRYDYDAMGRLTRRVHEGEAPADGSRPFIEERQYVWEGARLAAEAGYGPSATGENLRWRRTYVPGPSGLDDPIQVVVEIFQPGSPFSGETHTYTYLRDELGTVIGLVAEDEGIDPNEPPIPVRYHYTPYGVARAETGPELLRVRFDNGATQVQVAGGTVSQTVADETLSAVGAMELTWSLPLRADTLATGLEVERLDATPEGTTWTAVPEAEVAIGTPVGEPAVTDGSVLRVLLTEGWQRGESYRVVLEPTLADRLGRPYGRSETFEWTISTIPAGAPDGAEPPPVVYDRSFQQRYESWQAASDWLGGRFPAGQSRLFQGLWTDPVTGIAYARARWLDTRNATWLSEDPLGAVDSTNLYAFVGWQPNLSSDPLGAEAFEHSTTPGAALEILQSGFDPAEGASGYTWFEPAGQQSTGGPSMAGKTTVLRVEHSGAAEAVIPYRTHHGWYKEAEASLAEKGLAGRELQRAADAERWRRVGEYMKEKGRASYRVELGRGRGSYLALNRAGLRRARFTGLSGKGAGEVISKLTLAGRSQEAASAAEALGLSSKVAARFGRTASVIKWVGRPLVAVAIAADAYEIYEARYKARTTTSVVAGWAGAWAMMKLGAAWGARIGGGGALAAGQLGPQVAAPEEVVTVPVAAAIGGVLGGVGGGVGGYFTGRKITETTYDWVFGPEGDQ